MRDAPSVAKAILELPVPVIEADLPQEFNAAIKPHIASQPTTFSLPWPVSAIPMIGGSITFSDFTERFRVSEVEYAYRADGIITVYIMLEEGDPLNVLLLLELARLGFLVESPSDTSIAEVLTKAGLMPSAS